MRRIKKVASIIFVTVLATSVSYAEGHYQDNINPSISSMDQVKLSSMSMSQEQLSSQILLKFFEGNKLAMVMSNGFRNKALKLLATNSSAHLALIGNGQIIKKLTVADIDKGMIATLPSNTKFSSFQLVEIQQDSGLAQQTSTRSFKILKDFGKVEFFVTTGDEKPKQEVKQKTSRLNDFPDMRNLRIEPADISEYVYNNGRQTAIFYIYSNASSDGEGDFWTGTYAQKDGLKISYQEKGTVKSFVLDDINKFGDPYKMGSSDVTFSLVDSSKYMRGMKTQSPQKLYAQEKDYLQEKMNALLQGTFLPEGLRLYVSFDPHFESESFQLYITIPRELNNGASVTKNVRINIVSAKYITKKYQDGLMLIPGGDVPVKLNRVLNPHTKPDINSIDNNIIINKDIDGRFVTGKTYYRLDSQYVSANHGEIKLNFPDLATYRITAGGMMIGELYAKVEEKSTEQVLIQGWMWGELSAFPLRWNAFITAPVNTYLNPNTPNYFTTTALISGADVWGNSFTEENKPVEARMSFGGIYSNAQLPANNEHNWGYSACFPYGFVGVGSSGSNVSCNA